MSLVSLLPGGSDVWLCSEKDGSSCSSSGSSPLFLSTLLVFILLKADCFTHRFLAFLTSSLAIYSLLIALQINFPSTLLHLLLILSVGAHLPSLNGRNSTLLICFAGFHLIAYIINVADSALTLTFLALVTLMLRKIYVTGVTLAASTPTPLFFSFVSHLMPRYHFNEYQFFRADNPPEEVAQLRHRSFQKMKLHWDQKFPNGLEISHYLATSFSDLRFAGSNRVFIPFAKILSTWCDPCTVITKSDGVDLIDSDGNRLTDISGSYGVNVCGYERYKEFLTRGLDQVKDVGCVLGPVHPILKENIQMLKALSKKEEISFHMSGTEAVMCAVRLVRFNTHKPLVVVFGGAYHGWWDGIQPMAGNERTPFDVLTLKDVNPLSLEVIRLRANEIAAIVINPLQAFHPNAPPPSDLVLASNSRKANADNASDVSGSGISSSTKEYQDWLVTIRKMCNRLDIILVFDEVYTGFRLAPGGAQEYFDVVADVVVYGKTLGGGMPNGIVCGPRSLMARTDPKKPLRVAYVIGTFAAHPLLLGAMNEFLKFVTAPTTSGLYDALRKRVVKFVANTNARLAKEVPIELGDGSTVAPLKLASYSSVWTMLFQVPGRYHWMLQYYMKDEGVNLSWVGTGRLSFSLDFDDTDLENLQEKIIKACKRMKNDGWWYVPKGGEEDMKKNNLMIQMSLVKELAIALLKRVVS